MRFLRILPDVWARIVWSLSSFTRNIALGSSSATTPVNSIRSSLAIRPPVEVIATKRPENGLWTGFSQLDRGIAFAYTNAAEDARGRKDQSNERTAHVQPSRCPHPGLRIGLRPDTDTDPGAEPGSCADRRRGRPQDHRRAAGAEIFLGTDRAQRQGRPPGRRQA